MIQTIIDHIQISGFIGILGGYLLGSIPFGLVLCYIFGYGDIRKIGSGNIGATNVLRTGNKPLAAATLILDSSKGALAVFIAAYFGDAHTMFGAATGAILGHNFPVWLKFKGGKGVATTLGTILALSWPVGLLSCATWLVTAFLSRISSLSALIALAMAPLYAAYISKPGHVYLFASFAILGWIRHHQNLRRLWNGTEPRIGKKKTDAA